MVSVISRKITLFILLGSGSTGVQVQNGALQKPPIEPNDVRPVTVEGDKAICDGYGVVNDVSSKEEMEHIIRAVVQPLMKRIRVEWMARMPQEGVPPSKAQGVVRTSFTVMSDGLTKDVVITQPSAIASFNDAAIRGIGRRWLSLRI